MSGALIAHGYAAPAVNRALLLTNPLPGSRVQGPEPLTARKFPPGSRFVI
jgi:hypothetical protein